MEKAAKNKSVRAVPDGFHTVTPFLTANDASKLIDFMKQAFDADVTYVKKMSDGKIMHATVMIGNSIVMISDVMGDMKPQNGMLYLYVDDVDAMYKKAIKAKATSIHEPTNEFYGDRAAAVRDEFGNTWWMATHVEDVAPDELERRAKVVEKEQREKHDEVHA